MRPKISLAMMTHNEFEELSRLCGYLAEFRDSFCEIVVVDDFSTVDLLPLLDGVGAKLYRRPLDRNFSAQRNYLKGKCSGDFIFVLDPDEIPHRNMLCLMNEIIDKMEAVGADACSFPRLNLMVEPGASDIAPLFDNARLQQQVPDYQVRLIRNLPGISWADRVHERIRGITQAIIMPNSTEFCLLHLKTSQRQAAANELYRELLFRSPKHYLGLLGVKGFVKSLMSRAAPKELQYNDI